MSPTVLHLFSPSDISRTSWPIFGWAALAGVLLMAGLVTFEGSGASRIRSRNSAWLPFLCWKVVMDVTLA